jgi:hypothetical protein
MSQAIVTWDSMLLRFPRDPLYPWEPRALPQKPNRVLEQWRDYKHQSRKHYSVVYSLFRRSDPNFVRAERTGRCFAERL